METNPEAIKNAPVGQWMLVGFLSIVAIVLSIFYFSRPSAVPAITPESGDSFDASAALGVDESDSVTELDFYPNGRSFNFIVLFESGKSLVTDQNFNIVAEGDNRPVDLTKELPGSLISLRRIGNNGFIGGTANGELNYYVAQNGQLLVKKEIDFFKNSGAAIDAIAGAGSVTHILINKSANRIVAFNFDGAGRIYAATDSGEFKKLSSIQLSAGVVSSAFQGDNEFWALTSDGKLYVYDVSATEARAAYEVSAYGRLSGADFRNGKFLVYGYSLELKVPSVALYGSDGALIDLLTGKGENVQKNQPTGTIIEEDNLPNMSDIGTSYRDAKWLDNNLIGAVTEDKLIRIETDRLKVETRRLVLKPYEQISRFSRLPNGEYVFGTSAGRLLRKNLN